MSSITPVFDTILSYIRSLWTSERSDADSSRYSDLWLYSRITARNVWRLHQTIDRGIRAVFPKNTFGEFLSDWLFVSGRTDGDGGMGRLKASVSSGTDVLRVAYTGSPGAILNQELTDTAGRRYRATEELVGGGSPEDVDCESIDTGYDVNLESGQTLTFVNPPANVTAAATLVGDMDGGRPYESDADGLARLLDWTQTPPLSGNAAELRRCIEDALPGLVDGYVWPAKNFYPMGWGTVDYTATQRGESGDDRIITATQKSTIEAYVEANFPAAQYRASRCINVVPDPEKILVFITLSPGAEDSKRCDFDAYSLSALVSSYDESGLWIDANSGVDAALSSDDRVIIDGEEVVVDTVAPGGDLSKFTVDSWPTAWTGSGPTVGSVITSGGGVIQDVMDSIQAYVDTLSPERQETLAEPAIADDTLRPTHIQKAAIDADDNIVDVVVYLPASNYTPGPNDPDEDSVDMVTAQEIAVLEIKS